jgi:SAM-dependent methyltransferase
VRRATLEAQARGLTIQVHAADIRALPIQSRSMDVVFACDNALPHLLNEDEITAALAECLRCVRPGGGVLFSIRDYGAAPPEGTIERRPYGAREWNGQRYQLEQLWHWKGPRYDLELRIIPDPPEAGEATTLRTSYLALRPERLLELMTAAGFADAGLDRGRFFQPLLFGTRP